MNGFDKSAQRARAQNISAELASQGLSAPTLAWPIKAVMPSPPVPKPMNRGYVPVFDMAGIHLDLGDTVAYTWYNTSAMLRGKVIGFSVSGKSAKIEGKGASSFGGDQVFYRSVASIVKL